MTRGPLSPLRALLGLALALARAQLRDALSSRARRAALLAEGGAALGALFASAALGVACGVVGAGLLAHVVTSESATRAAFAASFIADAGAALVLLALAFSGTRGGFQAFDARPLATLPLRRSALTLAELTIVAAASPAALVAWPLGAGLVVGAAAAGPRVAAPTALAAAGLVASIFAAALLVARLLRAEGRESAPFRRALAHGALLVALLAILFVCTLSAGRPENAAGPLPTPGALVGATLRAALEGREAAALAAAIGPHLLALGLLALASLSGRPPRVARSKPPRRARLPASLHVVWGTREGERALAELPVALFALAVLPALLAAHGLSAPWIARGAALLGAWLSASLIAPLAGGLLREERGDAADSKEGSARPAGWLLGRLSALLAPPLALLGAAGLLLYATLGDAASALLFWAAGLGALAASSGAAALAAARWPSPPSASANDPGFAHPARLAASLGGAPPLLAALPALGAEGGGALSASAMLAACLGLLLALPLIGLARRTLARSSGPRAAGHAER